MEQSEALNGGLRVAQVLQKHSVPFLFTLCGGHISPILVESKRLGIRVIDVRNEATAVFAADAVARLTGIPGVAAVTAGPGVTNTITAVKNAQMAQSPLVLLGGATATMLKGRGSLQDIDQMAAMRPHVKWAFSVRAVNQIVSVLYQAFAIARSDVPGPVFIELPVDVLYPEALVREWYGIKPAAETAGLKAKVFNWYLKRHVDGLFADPGPAPTMKPARREERMFLGAVLERTARLLTRAKRPLLLVGSQATLDVANAPALREALGTIGVPVYLSGMARGVLGREHPLLMRHRRKEALKEADAIMLAGVPADFRLNYGRDFGTGCSLISVNLNPYDLRKNLRPNEAVLGSPSNFLRALAEAWPPHADRHRDWRITLQERDLQREREIDEQAGPTGPAVNPVALCIRIEESLAEDSVLVGDGGDFVATASYILRPRSPLSWLDPGVFGTLGAGAGFALGAKLCRPNAEVWLIYGDGSVGYTLPEWDTFVRHQVPVIGVIGNDGGWQQIARDQVDVLGDSVGTDLRQSDYHLAAQALGAEGLLIENDEQIGPGLRQAKSLAKEGKPVLINARCLRTEFRKGSLSI